MTDQDVPPPKAQMLDRALKPLGALPKHTQSLVLAGIALVMVLAIFFSGKQTTKRDPHPTPSSLRDSSLDTNQPLIEEYARRMEEEAARLQKEKAQLAAIQRQAGLAPGGASALPASPPPAPAAAYRSYEPPERDEIEKDQKRRNYQSLFAPVLVKSLRSDSPNSLAAHATPASGVSVAQPARAAAERANPYADLNQANGKQYRLFEGTFFETVLTNRLEGYFSGPVNCMITTDVYSHDGQHLLIPQGSRIIGEVRRVENVDQQRLAVTFHRLLMPDGYSVSLDKSPGLNQIGETGLRDQVNHHYGQVFGVSIAVGAIAGLAQANTRSGYDVSAADTYRQGVSASLSQSSLRILDRYLNVLPTFTIREGHRIKVYLTEDILVPAYENHQMPSDL